jgi:hypothetical protein
MNSRDCVSLLTLLVLRLYDKANYRGAEEPDLCLKLILDFQHFSIRFPQSDFKRGYLHVIACVRNLPTCVFDQI